ncbi:transcription antitermination factor NusB [Sinanaerobacter chloroacetimidivorans]|jgi:N utilization substance protein B|uniref:Transcription antitermination protein NusB n=1 Tax=Sinanaerobacter chloroacetimidivorans TaxID=2818044 RepID=A0A8J7VX31_9FIRM|nr:transcription antitermination factor NusB [Sinanaerobacter chloroacetimidivorans]MBR0596622.1 transcription antitermination factor NusB [Sinanaerobacter chloroacetimidivorans]
MRRTEARELFMQLLFQMDIQNDYSSELKGRFVSEYMQDSNQLEYFNQLYAVTSEHLAEIDKKLESCSENWKISRMAKVDLAVLRLSVAEILYMTEVPDSVSINEAVDLAKKFGGEDSGKFINGILGKVVKNKDV